MAFLDTAPATTSWPRWAPAPSRPELAVAVVAAAAWTALGVHALWPAHGHRVGPAWSGAVVEVVAEPVVMSLAMMLPAALPAARHVARSSLRWRRPRAVAEFAAAYAGLWAVYAVAAQVAVAPVGRSARAAGVALVLAAAWQLTPAKQHFVRVGHRAHPLAPTGARATAACLRFGRAHGAACIGSCWTLMLVPAVAPSFHVAWAAAVTGVILGERRSRRPRRAARRAAAVLAATGLLLAAA